MPTTLPQINEIAKPLVFSGLSWSEFKTIEPILDRPGIRLSYRKTAVKPCAFRPGISGVRVDDSA